MEDAKSITTMLEEMGSRLDTNDRDAAFVDDVFVSVAMDFINGDSYSTGDKKGFSIQVAPTSDPTKFVGFIEANIGKLPNEPQISGLFTPSFDELNEPGTRTKYTPVLVR